MSKKRRSKRTRHRQLFGGEQRAFTPASTTANQKNLFERYILPGVALLAGLTTILKGARDIISSDFPLSTIIWKYSAALLCFGLLTYFSFAHRLTNVGPRQIKASRSPRTARIARVILVVGTLVAAAA